MNLDQDRKEELDQLFDKFTCNRTDVELMTGADNIQIRTIRFSHSAVDQIKPIPGFRILFNKDTLYVQQVSPSMIRIKRLVTNCFPYISAITGFPLNKKVQINLKDFADSQNLCFLDDPGIISDKSPQILMEKSPTPEMSIGSQSRDKLLERFPQTEKQEALHPILDQLINWIKNYTMPLTNEALLDRREIRSEPNPQIERMEQGEEVNPILVPNVQPEELKQDVIEKGIMVPVEKDVEIIEPGEISVSQEASILGKRKRLEDPPILEKDLTIKYYMRSVFTIPASTFIGSTSTNFFDVEVYIGAGGQDYVGNLTIINYWGYPLLNLIVSPLIYLDSKARASGKTICEGIKERYDNFLWQKKLYYASELSYTDSILKAIIYVLPKHKSILCGYGIRKDIRNLKKIGIDLFDLRFTDGKEVGHKFTVCDLKFHPDCRYGHISGSSAKSLQRAYSENFFSMSDQTGVHKAPEDTELIRRLWFKAFYESEHRDVSTITQYNSKAYEEDCKRYND